jgi:hypothetical protein
MSGDEEHQGQLLADFAREQLGHVPEGSACPDLHALLAENRWGITCIPEGTFDRVSFDKALLQRMRIDAEASAMFEPRRRSFRLDVQLAPGRRCDAVRIVDLSVETDAPKQRLPASAVEPHREQLIERLQGKLVLRAIHDAVSTLTEELGVRFTEASWKTRDEKIARWIRENRPALKIGASIERSRRVYFELIEDIQRGSES